MLCYGAPAWLTLLYGAQRARRNWSIGLEAADFLACRASGDWHIFCSTPAHKASLRAIIGLQRLLVEQAAGRLFAIALKQDKESKQGFTGATVLPRHQPLNQDASRPFLDLTEDQECLKRL
jgi:hypothetical protein